MTDDRQSIPQSIHMVGIGGIGLSAIARVLAMRGHTITGSDMRGSIITEQLSALGVQVSIGHDSDHVGNAGLVLMSSAIPDSNPEVAWARSQGIPVVKRREFLAQLMAGQQGIAISGTHGKTTTSAMVATILQAAGTDPSYIIGGIVSAWGTNASAGQGDHFVIEADEYDRMFQGLAPRYAIVTNIEMDHPDCYRDVDDMREAYGVFLDRVSRDGLIVACTDSDQVRRLLSAGDIATEVVTYGRSADTDYRVGDVRPTAGGVSFAIERQGALWGRFRCGVPGMHNALNGAAALIIADRCGVDLAQAGEALAEFRGVGRRFEIKGTARDIIVIDDYAHHPTEISATLAAVRQQYPDREVWAVLQPHTHGRMAALFTEFVSCLSDADHVLVTEVYGARPHLESDQDADIGGKALARAIRHRDVSFAGTLDNATNMLLHRLAPGSVLITLGAGDGYLIGERVLATLEENAVK